ncbi:A/G-specific adenine glycosylase [Oceanobacillus sp. CAU 1775]
MVKEILRNFNIKAFQKDLVSWYLQNKRDLPWRKSQDPYTVWISEIMLQQTKVDTVIPYFNRFVEKYPTTHALAEADEEDVLKSWEGLGYYSRARNLQTAVREVVEKYEGKVPSEKEALGELKGVGPYTRGAILSIAFNQPEPAVDGNVMRVFSRVFLVDDDIAKARTRTHFETLVREVISEENPSAFNQGIMDLGATICTPKSPACLLCPVQEYCRAYAIGAENELPVKTKAKKQKQIAYAAVLIKNKEGKYLIEKRPETGLLANLYQFPMVPLENITPEKLELWFDEKYDLKIKVNEQRGQLKHVFSHLIWQIKVYTAEAKEGTVESSELLFVDRPEIDALPFPVPHLKMMEYLE